MGKSRQKENEEVIAELTDISDGEFKPHMCTALILLDISKSLAIIADVLEEERRFG